MVSGTGTAKVASPGTQGSLQMSSKDQAPRSPRLGSEGKAVGSGGFLGASEPVGEGGHGI